MSDPSQAEIKVQEFIEDYAPMVEEAPLLALNMIAKEGTILGVELQDEVTQVADLLNHALRSATSLYSTGAPPKKVASVEARIPRLKETYERKHALAMKLGDLTDRAFELVNAANGAAIEAEVETSLEIRGLMAVEERKVARPWWRRMFG